MERMREREDENGETSFGIASRKNMQHAREEIKEAYGSLEEFAAFAAFEEPRILESGVPLEKRAKLAGVSPSAMLVFNSKDFARIQREMIVMKEFGAEEQIEHFRQVAKIARNRNLRRSYRPQDIMAAGEYLERAKGVPMERREQNIVVPIQVNFPGPEAVEGGIPDSNAQDAGNTIEHYQAEDRASSGGSEHSPRRAGDLPPQGARAFRQQARQRQLTRQGVQLGSDIDFYSGETASGEAPLKEDVPEKARYRDSARERETRRRFFRKKPYVGNSIKEE